MSSQQTLWRFDFASIALAFLMMANACAQRPAATGGLEEIVSALRAIAFGAAGSFEYLSALEEVRSLGHARD